MQAVLIAMTIFGCDDSVTQCNYVATVEKHWQSVHLCDAESERRLKTFANVNYPTVIAVCEPTRQAAEAPSPAATAQQQPPATAKSQPASPPPGRLAGFAAQTAARVRQMLPTGQSVRTALLTPVHFVSGSYSWVAQHLGN